MLNYKNKQAKRKTRTNKNYSNPLTYKEAGTNTQLEISQDFRLITHVM